MVLVARLASNSPKPGAVFSPLKRIESPTAPVWLNDVDGRDVSGSSPEGRACRRWLIGHSLLVVLL